MPMDVSWPRSLLLTKKESSSSLSSSPLNLLLSFSQYCGKPSTSSFEDFVVVVSFVCFWFFFSYLTPYHTLENRVKEVSLSGKCFVYLSHSERGFAQFP